MKKLIAGSILAACLTLAANDYHGHSPHKCHSNLATHGQCEHGKRNKSGFQSSGPEGVDYEGCICFWGDCGWAPNNWVSWQSFKAYLNARIL